MRAFILAIALSGFALAAGGFEVVGHEDGAAGHSIHTPTAYRSALLAALDPIPGEWPIDFGHHGHCASVCATPLALAVTAAALALPLLVAASAVPVRQLRTAQLVSAPATLPPR